MQHHNWSLEEIESMIPWEREVYILQLQNWLQKEKQRIEAQNARRNR
jgi:uncharacterized protein (DUF934 family)|tara:strand:+ start:274 stop:414 length:141 start_codon:yes stop_codon:yes gene_type:complete